MIIHKDVSPPKNLFVSIILFFTFSTAQAQFFLGVKLIGISFHPGENIPETVFKFSIGKKHLVAFDPAIAISV
ncbi:MAG: hypothetical protein ABIQ40_14720 [Bacteroidia bacterium]